MRGCYWKPRSGHAMRPCGTARSRFTPRSQPAGHAVGGDLRAVRRRDGVRRRAGAGALPVGGEPPRPLGGWLRAAHLVVALVAEDGTKARGARNDRPRAQRACRELGERHELGVLEACEGGTGSRGIKLGERQADARRLRDHVDRGEHPDRGSPETLERIVRACPTASCDESEFVQRLREEGCASVRATATKAPRVVVVYSVKLPGADPGRERMVWYGGGRLARDLTLPSLCRAWRQDAASQRCALAGWSPWTASPPRSEAERRPRSAPFALHQT